MDCLFGDTRRALASPGHPNPYPAMQTYSLYSRPRSARRTSRKFQPVPGASGLTRAKCEALALPLRGAAQDTLVFPDKAPRKPRPHTHQPSGGEIVFYVVLGYFVGIPAALALAGVIGGAL